MQQLGAKFYEREHTKPLFHKNSILTNQNLCNYHLCIETLFKFFLLLKTLKLLSKH